jgi:hypothetical protein
VATGSEALVVVGSWATGVGVGASVVPALFTTGFTLPSPELPRVFALIELLRGVAAFLAGPLLLHMSETVGAARRRAPLKRRAVQAKELGAWNRVSARSSPPDPRSA